MKQRKLLVSWLSMTSTNFQSATTTFWVDINLKMTENLYNHISTQVKESSKLSNVVVTGIIPCEEFRDKPQG